MPTSGISSISGAAPEIEEMPLVGIPVHGVERDPRAADLLRSLAVGEARQRLPHLLLADLLRGHAGRNSGAVRVSAQVDVDFAASALEPDETGLIFSGFAAHRDSRAPSTPDPGRERARDPGGTVDAEPDPVGELLPAGTPGVRALRRRRGG